MEITLQVIGYHDCDGCSRKVITAVSRIGVELAEFDRENGIVTVISAADQNPQVIRYNLQRRVKKRVVVLSRDLMLANQNPNSIVSNQVRTNRSLDGLEELGQVVFRLARVLDGVEITSSNTLRINFIRREIGGGEFAPPGPPPWAAMEPSAPLMPSSSVAEQAAVYGYPPEFYGISTPRDQNGCCIII